MFDIGFSELLVVFVVGLIILGPERLPMAAKTAGLWVRKIRRSIQSVQREINAQLDQEELQRSIKETNDRILRETADFQKQAEAPATPKQTSEAPSSTSPQNVAATKSQSSQAADDVQTRA
ncbi:Sec-independent protein translocase protein TatB [Rhodanobacter aciditrophus]|uniref:Sec-independent protein translocase protein TatB n=1 Tax=Rhodanobacter aciditrophus TaxID=1623218 RepID=A0ABW4B0I1_9GAMM